MTDPHKAKDAAADDLMDKANVQGVAVGEKHSGGRPTGKEAIIVLVSRKVDKDALAEDDMVPAKIDGVPTDVIEVGHISKRIVSSRGVTRGYHRDRATGICPGDSCGHTFVTAGTIGALVTNAAGRHFILSNNHVLAAENRGRRGDAILAPGPYDGGEVGRDQIGELANFIPIDFTGRPNKVDAAIAEVNAREVQRSIRWLGVPRGSRDPVLGDRLRKFGRTTDFTMAKVIAVNARLSVWYDQGSAVFDGQVLTTDMSDGGDSGSLALDDEGRAAALLYAGSPTVTVFNPISLVLGALGVEV